MKYDVINGSLIGASVVLTATQVDEVFRWIQLALTVLASIVSLCFTIWNWYKKAKADGKITPDEIADGLKIAQDGVENIQNTIKGEEKDGKN